MTNAQQLDAPCCGPDRGVGQPSDVEVLCGPEATAGLSEADGWSHDYIAAVHKNLFDNRGRSRAALPRPDNLPTCHVADIQYRLSQYVKTGERGWLVDVGRIAMAEWIETDMEPCAPHIRGELCKK
jgi:hypothetical protein